MLAEALVKSEVRPMHFRHAMSDDRNASATTRGSARCNDCRLRSQCMPEGLSQAGREEFRSLVFSHRRLHTGQSKNLTEVRTKLSWCERTCWPEQRDAALGWQPRGQP